MLCNTSVNVLWHQETFASKSQIVGIADVCAYEGGPESACSAPILATEEKGRKRSLRELQGKMLVWSDISNSSSEALDSDASVSSDRKGNLANDADYTSMDESASSIFDRSSQRVYTLVCHRCGRWRRVSERVRDKFRGPRPFTCSHVSWNCDGNRGS